MCLIVFALTGCSTGSRQSDLSMSDKSNKNLFDFLDQELTLYGIVTVNDANRPQLREWSIARDDAGFTVTAAPEVSKTVRAYLESVFPPARFDDGETLIFRDDERSTTAMLNWSDSETQLIVLHWQDAAVQSRIADAQQEAIGEVFNKAGAEMDTLVQEMLATTDEEEKAAKLEAVISKSEEIAEAARLLLDEDD